MLKGALVTPRAKHYAAILEPMELGGLLRAIDDYTGYPVTRFALQIAPHVFVRPGELRHAEWREIDLVEGIWKIPAGKMKSRKPHAVPLSKQVIGLLTDLAEMLDHKGYVFPSARSFTRPMSENALNAAFRRMGFSKDEVTAHGLRATASTFLNESGLWNPDAIERALAHGDSNAVRGASLLLRRVMNAFDVTPDQVRFVATSATIWAAPKPMSKHGSMRCHIPTHGAKPPSHHANSRSFEREYRIFVKQICFYNGEY